MIVIDIYVCMYKHPVCVYVYNIPKSYQYIFANDGMLNDFLKIFCDFFSYLALGKFLALSKYYIC